MPKVTKAFFCQSCGSQFSKWLGRCPNCGEWNTMVEEVLSTSNKKTATSYAPESSSRSRSTKAQSLNSVEARPEERLQSPDPEFDRVTGGGMVAGSLILMGGEPGIGKSTLLLQICLGMQGRRMVYVCGEESLQQVKMRAERLGLENPDCLFLPETQTQNIFKQLQEVEPEFVVVDSIQTLQSAFVESGPGSVSQVRECAAELLKYAKESGTPVLLIGHITKEGSLAGPKVLEHMVDTVLQFEGDSRLAYRILRTMKNRFGSTSELGIYYMRSDGLQPVTDPSELLLGQREAPISGIAVGGVLEGNRPLMIEVQVLVNAAAYGTPQRTATGYDTKRLNLLLAVLEKRAEYQFGPQDVFLNITGGFKIDDPAADLAVAAALSSGIDDRPLPENMIFIGEVGLGGEVRSVSQIENRLNEAERLGFRYAMISKYGSEELVKERYQNLQLLPIATLNDMFELLMHLS